MFPTHPPRRKPPTWRAIRIRETEVSTSFHSPAPLLTACGSVGTLRPLSPDAELFGGMDRERCAASFVARSNSSNFSPMTGGVTGSTADGYGVVTGDGMSNDPAGICGGVYGSIPGSPVEGGAELSSGAADGPVDSVSACAPASGMTSPPRSAAETTTLATAKREMERPSPPTAAGVAVDVAWVQTVPIMYEGSGSRRRVAQIHARLVFRIHPAVQHSATPHQLVRPIDHFE